MRTLKDIRDTGVSYCTEAEFAHICDELFDEKLRKFPTADEAVDAVAFAQLGRDYRRACAVVNGMRRDLDAAKALEDEVREFLAVADNVREEMLEENSEILPQWLETRVEHLSNALQRGSPRPNPDDPFAPSPDDEPTRAGEWYAP